MATTVARTAKPQHYVRQQLRPIGNVHDDGFSAVTLRVAYRVRKNRSATTAGSYVLGDEQGYVYVLPEGAASTEPMVSKLSAWVVGRYASGDKCEYPAPSDLMDDLESHFDT